MFLDVSQNEDQKRIVTNIADSWYLVNVVDNNFLSVDLFEGMVDLTIAKTAKRHGA